MLEGTRLLMTPANHRPFAPPVRTPWVIVVTAALMMAGCGDPKPTPSSDASATIPTSTTAAPSTTDARPAATTARVTIDPCELLTIDDAQRILPQATLQPAVPMGSEGDLGCQYPGDPTKSVAQVEIYVGDGAKKSFDIDKDTLGHEFEPVPNIGDEAWYEDSNVFLRKGSKWVQIRVVTLELQQEQIKANLLTAANTLAAKL